MAFGKKDDKRDEVVEGPDGDATEGSGNGAGEHGFSGVYPGAAYARTRPPETGGRTFIIIHEASGGGRKINQFDSQPEAQAFVERLLCEGIIREAIDTYWALKFDFDVSFRPVVDFKAAALDRLASSGVMAPSARAPEGPPDGFPGSI